MCIHEADGLTVATKVRDAVVDVHMTSVNSKHVCTNPRLVADGERGFLTLNFLPDAYIVDKAVSSATVKFQVAI